MRCLLPLPLYTEQSKHINGYTHQKPKYQACRTEVRISNFIHISMYCDEPLCCSFALSSAASLYFVFCSVIFRDPLGSPSYCTFSFISPWSVPCLKYILPLFQVSSPALSPYTENVEAEFAGSLADKVDCHWEEIGMKEKLLFIHNYSIKTYRYQQRSTANSTIKCLVIVHYDIIMKL